MKKRMISLVALVFVVFFAVGTVLADVSLDGKLTKTLIVKSTVKGETVTGSVCVYWIDAAGKKTRSDIDYKAGGKGNPNPQEIPMPGIITDYNVNSCTILDEYR